MRTCGRRELDAPELDGAVAVDAVPADVEHFQPAVWIPKPLPDGLAARDEIGLDDVQLLAATDQVALQVQVDELRVDVARDGAHEARALGVVDVRVPEGQLGQRAPGRGEVRRCEMTRGV